MHKILGVGCDLVDIERIKNAIQAHSDSFIEKIFLAREIAYCQSYKDPFSHFAARFSAKEAVSKALGVGIGKQIGWHDIEITLNDLKKPGVLLLNEAAKKYGSVHFELSLSHTESTAMAFVIAFSS